LHEGELAVIVRGETPPAAARGRKADVARDAFDFGPLFSDPAEEEE
jgi:hypothetical protein